jgi:hypothetical protein
MAKKRIAKRTRAADRSLSRRLALRITIRGIEPPIWRELSVPDSYSLLQLHRCIQLVFDWMDYHLFEFRIGSRRFGRSEYEMGGEDSAAAHLSDLGLATGAKLLYLYDMGDGWEHDIVVRSAEKMPRDEEADSVASLIDGARAAPPEDVGGPPGYERLLLALERRASDEDEELVAWAGEDFAPELFDRRAVNHALVLAGAWDVI